MVNVPDLATWLDADLDVHSQFALGARLHRSTRLRQAQRRVPPLERRTHTTLIKTVPVADGRVTTKSA
jgi:hypothetical protein